MKKKKRFGRVGIHLSYVVDLDDKDMIEEAKDCFYEDIMNAYKYDELHTWVDVFPDSNVDETDIPEFLTGKAI